MEIARYILNTFFMRAITLPKFDLQKATANFREGFNQLSSGGFQKIFDQIDQMGIKKGVDQMGIDKFINQCALLAAGSGVITGAGGITTMLIGVPLDIINLITQQFRVTLAVSYHNTGSYKFSFNEFFKIVASSLKVDTGMAMSKTVGSKTARRLVPVVGAVIGGTANYLFIKRMADSVRKNQPGKKVVRI
jgi:hypothetical protein